MNIEKVLRLHVLWLDDKETGERADLHGANLHGADLHGADLAGADLAGADLTGADLHGADLAGADLAGADLAGADLHGANLHGADLHGADLTLCADLAGADLTGADLAGADLAGADLHGANLQSTCLDPAALCPVLSDAEIVSAGLRIVGDYVWGYRTQRSVFCGSTYYQSGYQYTAPVFSVDQNTSCHPGRYLTSLAVALTYEQPLVRVYCRRDELIHACGKWRCKRLWVYGRYEGGAR